MVMCDFHIDSKNEKFNNHDKFNNFCDTFSLAKLVEDHTCFTKKHKFPIDLLFVQDPKGMLLEGTKSLTDRKQ